MIVNYFIAFIVAGHLQIFLGLPGQESSCFGYEISEYFFQSLIFCGMYIVVRKSATDYFAGFHHISVTLWNFAFNGTWS